MCVDEKFDLSIVALSCRKPQSFWRAARLGRGSPIHSSGRKGITVMHPPSTLVYLELSWAEAADGDDSLRGAAFLMGLRYPGAYWVELALQWAEQGCPLNPEAIHELQRIAGSSSKQFSQQLRHRASALLRRSASGVAGPSGRSIGRLQR